MMGVPRSRSLLVTFDAFETLFSPRRPVHIQYAQVAREFGVHVDPEGVRESFGPAYRGLCEELPNYGKASGMTPEKWWKMLIIRTFQPLLPHSKRIPRALPPALITHFASASAYTLHPIVPALLHRLRSCPITPRHPAPTTIGIISNSDPRVPFIIRDLGVAITHYETSAPRESRAHLQDTPTDAPTSTSTSQSSTASPTDLASKFTELSTGRGRTVETRESASRRSFSAPPGTNGTVDFLTLSYDVGVSKPDKGIFEAAEKAALDVVGEGADEEWELVRRRIDEGEMVEMMEKRKRRWTGRRVHVGDEWRKDVQAAREAGWEGVLWRDDITLEEMVEKLLGPEEE
ncbi:hypothetical protein EX30DRAFT_263698 [Ascodesmis nigricans]|uniref:HAD-like protein n=1 Tax=Ascodesmis nigricans TaxID=341454 RepID=A0A4S2MXX3_9PEZI|nr:hypothetical protein EX30DRAFT_263698 [Ascodesmis nigricans]